MAIFCSGRRTDMSGLIQREIGRARQAVPPSSDSASPPPSPPLPPRMISRQRRSDYGYAATSMEEQSRTPSPERIRLMRTHQGGPDYYDRSRTPSPGGIPVVRNRRIPPVPGRNGKIMPDININDGSISPSGFEYRDRSRMPKVCPSPTYFQDRNPRDSFDYDSSVTEDSIAPSPYVPPVVAVVPQRSFLRLPARFRGGATAQVRPMFRDPRDMSPPALTHVRMSPIGKRRDYSPRRSYGPQPADLVDPNFFYEDRSQRAVIPTPDYPVGAGEILPPDPSPEPNYRPVPRKSPGRFRYPPHPGGNYLPKSPRVAPKTPPRAPSFYDETTEEEDWR